MVRHNPAGPARFFLCSLLVSVIFALPALSQNPVGWWKFNDGQGTRAVDSSGYGHNATLMNGVQWVSGRQQAYAASANALNRQYVSVPTINLSSTKAVTLTLWVNRTYTTSGGAHLLFEASTNFNWSTTGFALIPDDGTCLGISAAIHGDVGYTTNCYNNPTSGVWHHLAVVYDKTQSAGNAVMLYVDGVLQSPSRNLYAATNTNYFGNNPIYLFSRAGGSGFNSGIVEDFRIYPAALTAGQIQRIYNGSCILTAQPASLSFPDTYVGQRSQGTTTLTNTCSRNITIQNVSESGSQFVLTPVKTPLILGPGKSTPVNVAFAPTVAGQASGTVTVTSDATNGTLVVPLSGKGIVQNQQHYVTLQWNASTSQVAGYNAYRSTNQNGPYTKLNSSLISVTQYSDNTVQSGYTYYYVATAVDSLGNESVYSNQTSASIP